MADFRAIGEGYQLTEPGLNVQFDLTRLRRDRGELMGELAVSCGMLGTRAIDGYLAIGNFNVSAPRSRQERAKYLQERGRTGYTVDWLGLLEELSQRVLSAERAGRPAIRLCDMPRPAPADTFTMDGVRLLRDHPTILFGDGGSMKSYLALYWAGVLAGQGVNVLFADWELAGEDHRERLERLFGASMPREIHYARCDRPMTAEVDRLARLVAKHGAQFLVCDSIAFGCDGPPEAAEVAGRYMQCIRQIGKGSLLLAHTNRSENADQKPFGSTFWHNGARMTYHVKQAAEAPEGATVIGVYPRKSNLGPLGAAVGFDISFADDRTRFRRTDLAQAADLAAALPLRQRILGLVRTGPLKLVEIAEELGAKVESVERTINRYPKLFARVTNTSDRVTRIALAEREVA
jgi:hypothetical protein